MFAFSPFIGTGFGSFDDIPFKGAEIAPLMGFNAQAGKVFSDAHAHNSYLHLLAEQGLVGLGLFVAFWISLFRYLRLPSSYPITQRFLLIAFFVLTFASFTEHRIATPSNVLPFSLMLGIYVLARTQAVRASSLGLNAVDSSPSRA
jgi:O-antigen ligase